MPGYLTLMYNVKSLFISCEILQKIAPGKVFPSCLNVVRKTAVYKQHCWIKCILSERSWMSFFFFNTWVVHTAQKLCVGVNWLPWGGPHEWEWFSNIHSRDCFYVAGRDFLAVYSHNATGGMPRMAKAPQQKKLLEPFEWTCFMLRLLVQCCVRCKAMLSLLRNVYCTYVDMSINPPIKFTCNKRL